MIAARLFYSINNFQTFLIQKILTEYTLFDNILVEKTFNLVERNVFFEGFRCKMSDKFHTLIQIFFCIFYKKSVDKLSVVCYYISVEGNKR